MDLVLYGYQDGCEGSNVLATPCRCQYAQLYAVWLSCLCSKRVGVDNIRVWEETTLAAANKLEEERRKFDEQVRPHLLVGLMSGLWVTTILLLGQQLCRALVIPMSCCM